MRQTRNTQKNIHQNKHCAPKYYTIDELVNMIDTPNKEKCILFLKENKKILKSARGSKNNHQAWGGGYIDHITEVMNTTLILYDSLNNLRKLPFSVSDALLVLFLHDIEKPWKYEFTTNKYELKKEMKDRMYVKQFARAKISEYGFVLSDEHINALDYVEGEIGTYTPNKKSMGRLAAFCHLNDAWSARGWFDEPKKHGEKNTDW